MLRPGSIAPTAPREGKVVGGGGVGGRGGGRGGGEEGGGHRVIGKEAVDKAPHCLLYCQGNKFSGLKAEH